MDHERGKGGTRDDVRVFRRARQRTRSLLAAWRVGGNQGHRGQRSDARGRPQTSGKLLQSSKRRRGGGRANAHEGSAQRKGSIGLG
jgi:hypothetical protein